MSSGIGFSELLILFLIGLIVLGPERLPKVANQVGTMIGKARRMTRVMKRQLEEELDVEKNLGFNPSQLDPAKLVETPRDDDTYSPEHDDPQVGSIADAAMKSADNDVLDVDTEKPREHGHG